jgi:glycosyltransferase involved in cell wall biosynthesis
MLVSVVTPAYDRAHTLRDAFASLGRQGIPLEWVVVDDGSTDGTAELVGELSRGSPFRVVYLRQEHAGKWAAVNRGVAAARGELVAQLDSDDRVRPGALDRLAGHWRAIPAREAFAGVTGLDEDESGQVIGDRFPADILDATWHEVVYRHRVRGDKWGILRTDILRAHPFPPGLGFEGRVWRGIGQCYKMRYVNDVFLTRGTAGAGNLSRTPYILTAGSAAAAYAEMLNGDMRWFRHAPGLFLKHAALLARAMLHQGFPLRRQATTLHTWPARALWAAALPLGVLLYRHDLRHAPQMASRPLADEIASPRRDARRLTSP